MNMRPTGRAQVPRMVEGGVSSLQVPRIRNAIQSVGWTIERSISVAWFFPKVKRQPVEMLSHGTSPRSVKLTGPQDWLVIDMKYCCPIAGDTISMAISRTPRAILMVSPAIARLAARRQSNAYQEMLCLRQEADRKEFT